jgi:flavin reductase (DIM6/NTAB) family NADH-FMN oxidoreductase RutF
MLDRAADPNWFREVLGQYPTGVSVITAIDESERPVGMVVGSFTSVSLDPPLVAFLPAAQSGSWARIRTSSGFCVNVLASDQESVCRIFASSAADKFAGIGWQQASSGSPILDGAVAWIDCDFEAVHDAGDHHIVLGRVRDLESHRATLPLLFFRGGYGRFAPLSLATREERFARQLKLIDRARPLMEETAQRLGVQVAAAHCDGTELTVLATAGTVAHIPAAGIGERIAVVPPIGIWWMAFAEADQIARWLAHIEDEDRQRRFRSALDAIRQRGFCLGQSMVVRHVEKLLAARTGAGAEPTESERHAFRALALDPAMYVPSDPDDYTHQPTAGEPFGVWAPTPGRDRLGLMLAGMVGFEKTLSDYAEDLLRLAAEVGQTYEVA